MRYVTARCPAIERILLVESGSRSITERVLPKLPLSFTDLKSIDVVTCYGGAPAGLSPDAAVYRTQDHVTAAERAALLRRVRDSQADRGGDHLLGRAHHDALEMVARGETTRQDSDH